MDIVEATWKELGFQIRPLHHKLVVRTAPPPVMTESGLLFLPPKEANFYGGLPHQRIIRATVLATHRTSKMNIGEYICFQRLFFARCYYLEEPDAFVGIIDENQLVGYVESSSHPDTWKLYLHPKDREDFLDFTMGKDFQRQSEASNI